MTIHPPARGPRTAEIVGALTGAAIALAPGSLPRAVGTHVILVTACVLLGAGVGAATARLLPRRTPGPTRTSRVVGCTAMATFICLVAANLWWQDTLRSALDMPALGMGWVAASLAPVAFYTVLRLAPRVTVIVAATVAVAASGLAPASASGVVSADPTARAAEFVTAAATPRSLRLYSALDGTPLERRAVDLVDRWVSAGGLDRAAVVVAIPTGSGWVDQDAIEGFEERLHGDVAILALQYDDTASWRAFIGGTTDARHSATAVAAALVARIDRVPVGGRPQIYLYGQSLGAVGADAARASVTDHAAICATVIAGPPAGSVAARADRRLVLANASDPVVRWSPRLLWRPPARWTATADLPRPPWFPLASFVQASADLLGALSFPAGHGHQYGAEQGLRAPLCAGQTSAPRAAS